MTAGRRMALLLALWFPLVGGGVLARAAGTSPATRQARSTASPQDVVLILTDDQRIGTLQYMPKVQRLLVSHGVEFTGAVDNNPLCCPSRTTMMTGLTSGHDGVWWNQNSSTGGYRAFLANGDENRTIFRWLHDAGYHTGLIGKFLNGYAFADIGWTLRGVDDWQAFLLDDLTVPACHPDGYFATCYSNDGVLQEFPSSAYSTTTSGNKAVRFISGTPTDQRLFLYYAPRAPHLPTLPEGRYASACPDVPDISGPSFNTAIVNGPSYIAGRRPWSASKIATTQAYWHDDCRTLLSVDDQVARIVRALRSSGRLRNTLIMFVSDNGFLFGEHRWLGKTVPWDESIRVPLVIRDDAAIPAATRGTLDNRLVTNLDFAPTFLDAAGITQPGLDGQSLLPLLTGGPGFVPESDVLIEHQGGKTVPAYCGVRTVNSVYVRYSTGEEEFYDLTADPQELTNVAGDPHYATRMARDKAAAQSLCVPTPEGFSWS